MKAYIPGLAHLELHTALVETDGALDIHPIAYGHLMLRRKPMDDLQPTFLGNTALVGIRRDELGVESVCAFGVMRQGGSTVSR